MVMEQVTSQINETRQVAVLFLDLDGFRKVNDTAGHKAGNRLLRIIAQRLLTCVRQGDTLTCPGDDESVMLLDNVCSLGEAERLAKCIVHSIA